MSLKDSVVEGIRRVSEDLVPGVKASVGGRIEELRTRFDEINCSLASKALPEGRRESVRNLILERKSALAVQKRKAVRVVSGGAQSSDC